MKIALSNIAWNEIENDHVIALMHQYNIAAVEVAPAKINPVPEQISLKQAQEYKQFWQQHGITICSMQALLYKGPQTALFAGAELRQNLLDYLSKIIEIAAILGVKRLVFGSPNQRQRGELEFKQAQDIAIDFFHQVGTLAAKHELMLCIEPNPTAYNCDFINTSQEGWELVNAVNHPGFGLHLDTGGMTLSQENIPAALQRLQGKIDHFHISEKDLLPIGSGTVNHQPIATTLKQIRYQGWCSIEMKTIEQDPIGKISHALNKVCEIYGTH